MDHQVKIQKDGSIIKKMGLLNEIDVFPGILFRRPFPGPSTVADFWSNSGAVATGGTWIRVVLDPEKVCRVPDITAVRY